MYVKTDTSTEVINSAVTERTTARVDAWGTSVIDALTLNPSIQQITPVNIPGIMVFASRFKTSNGETALKTLLKKKYGGPGLAPSKTPLR